MENKKVIKRLAIAIGIVFALFIGFSIGNDGITEKDVAAKQEEIDEMINTIDNKNSQIEELTKSKEELDTLKEETKNYTSLTEDEKKIINEKIVEVKNATQEQKEAEQRAIEEEKARKAAEEKAKKEAEEQAKREAEAQKYETGLTWEQIAREGKVGTLGKFEGKIIQVMNGTGFKQYRVAINGSYDNIMLIEVQDEVVSETLLEDDYVYFKGESLGQYTYKTVLGAEMTVPAFEVHEITR